MEDILASIKRVIKEGEPTAPRRGADNARPLPIARDADEVLELKDPAPAAPFVTATTRAQRTAPQQAAPAPEPVAPVSHPELAAAVEGDRGDLSDSTVQAARGAFASLSRLMVKPEPDSDGTLEGLVREMLRPMLAEWLDANLPAIVEQMVAREIARITAEG